VPDPEGVRVLQGHLLVSGCWCVWCWECPLTAAGVLWRCWECGGGSRGRQTPPGNTPPFPPPRPQQLGNRLAFHQQAADELGGDLLGGAGEEALGEGLGVRGGYGSGFGVLKAYCDTRHHLQTEAIELLIDYP